MLHAGDFERFQAAAMRRAVDPAVMERLVSDALIAQREAWFGWYDRGRAVDFADRLAEIAVPTIVVSGEHDPLAPPQRVKRDVGATFVFYRCLDFYRAAGAFGAGSYVERVKALRVMDVSLGFLAFGAG